MGSVTIMELQLLTVTAPVGWAGTRIIPGADCLMNNYQEPGPGAIISGSGAGDKRGVSREMSEWCILISWHCPGPDLTRYPRPLPAPIRSCLEPIL